MLKKIKNIFNGRKWNTTRTRKKMLFLSIIMAIVCFGMECLLATSDHHIDSTLISEWFSYAKWICGGSLCISLSDIVVDKVGTIVKTVKGVSDTQEENVDDEVIDE